MASTVDHNTDQGGSQKRFLVDNSGSSVQCVNSTDDGVCGRSVDQLATNTTSNSSEEGPSQSKQLMPFCDGLMEEAKRNYTTKLNYFNGSVSEESKVCVATQLTVQRMDQLKRMADHWTGTCAGCHNGYVHDCRS